MVTRRTVLLTGLGLMVAVSARQTSELDDHPPSPQPHVADILAQMVPAVLAMSVDVEHYARFFRRRWQRMPTRRLEYQHLAERLNVFCLQAGPRQRAEAVESFVRENEAELGPFRGEVLQHFAHTDAWICLGYPCWPGRPDPARISPL